MISTSVACCATGITGEFRALPTMQDNTARVAIVGADPAGLAAARYLSDRTNVDITLFEKGRNLSARLCPVDIGVQCGGCKGLCNVIAGFGGSMHYGDSIKLSLLPAGRRLRELFGARKSTELMENALRFFQKSEQEIIPKSPKLSKLFEKSPFDLRDYDVIEVAESDLKRILVSHYFYLKNNVNIKKRSRVISVEKNKDEFYIEYHQQGNRYSQNFDFVILGTGGAGRADCKKILLENCVKTSPPWYSIGIRVELPNEYLELFYKLHADLKFSSVDGFAHKIKSLCFSAGPMGGKLKFCNYADQFRAPVTFLDGHSVYENNSSFVGAHSNIAILAQVDEGINWLEENLIEKYIGINKGLPIWQPAGEFCSNEHREASSYFETPMCAPSNSTLIRGNIADLLPDSLRESLSAATIDFLRIVAEGTGRTISDVIKQCAIVAPAVEFFWDVVDVSPSMETSINGLYVVGDSAGIAQGNLQAVMTGIAASSSISDAANWRRGINLGQLAS